jgi:hypothetical protein
LISSDASFGSNLLAWRLKGALPSLPTHQLLELWGLWNSVCLLGYFAMLGYSFAFTKNLQNLIPSNDVFRGGKLVP